MQNELKAMQTYTNTLALSLSSKENWLAFLDFAADFTMPESQMKHGFSTQISVYGSLFKDTVCLTEDDWAKYDRFPIDDEASIPVLSTSDNGTVCEISLIPQNYTEIFDEENAIPLPSHEIGNFAAQIQSSLAAE